MAACHRIELVESRLMLAVFGEDLSYDPGRPPPSVPTSQLIARLPDGDLLAAGDVDIPDDIIDMDPQKTILSRVNADGSLDTSFGNNGQVDIGTEVRITYDEPRGRLLYLMEKGNDD